MRGPLVALLMMPVALCSYTIGLGLKGGWDQPTIDRANNRAEVFRASAEAAEAELRKARVQVWTKWSSGPASFTPAHIVDVQGFIGVQCLSFNDKTQTWERLRNPADFVPPVAK